MSGTGGERKLDGLESKDAVDAALAGAHSGGIVETLAKRAKKRKKGRLQRGPGTVWQSAFMKKSRRQRRALILQPWKYPVASQQLAAIEIQRIVRGFLVRKANRKPVPLKRSVSMRQKYEMANLAGEEKKLDEERAAEYDVWCRERIQSWWRMLLVKREYDRNRFSMYHIAAMQIQYLWKAHTRQRYLELSRPSARTMAALRIQRAWRSFTNMRIYRYYRDLIRFRNTGDPALMLRSINPREAGLVDRASGMKVRFRLGGAAFPPQIYYKIFTTAALCDLGAFAPRDYTRVRGMEAAQRHNRATDVPTEGHGPDDSAILEAAYFEGTGQVIRVGTKFIPAKLGKEATAQTSAALAATGGANASARFGKGAYASLNASEEGGSYPPGWYRRCENNGWRPVSLKSLEEADEDPITRATNKLATEFHYSKVKRREDAVKKRKRRKRKWLMKMYTEGLAKERGVDMGRTAETLDEIIDFDSKQWEEDADELLQWSSTLDFDTYLADWQAVGLSGGADAGLGPGLPDSALGSTYDSIPGTTDTYMSNY